MRRSFIALLIPLILLIPARLMAQSPVISSAIQQALVAPVVIPSSGFVNPTNVILTTSKAPVVSITINGTFTGLTATVQARATNSSTFAGPLNLITPSGSGVVTSITGTGTWNIDTSGQQAIQLNVTALASGSMTVAFGGSTGTPLMISCPDGTTSCFGGGGGSGNQGTPNTVGNAWPVTLALGGALASATNPSPVIPGTSANFAKETGGNLASILTALGSPFQAGGTLGANQGTPNTSANAWPILIAPTASASFGIAPGSSTSAESSHILKASPGNLYSTSATTGASSGYFMIFNLTAAPSNGAVTPAHCWPVPANSAISYGTQGEPPDVYTTGIVDVFSTTGCTTLTLSATAFFDWKVQ